MKTALVTGSGGFIGRALVRRLLANGVDVTTVGTTPAALPGTRHFALGSNEWARSQWRSVLEASSPDTIFHLAGKFRGPAAELWAVNVRLLETLLAELDQLDAKPTLLIVGSAAEYGQAFIDGEPMNEDAPRAPVPGTYGESKAQQTDMAMAFAARTDARVIIARIFNAIGPGMPRSLALGDFAAQIAAMDDRGGVLRTGNLDVWRDLIDIEQVTTVLSKLPQLEDASGVVNVCSGEAFHLRTLIERMITQSRKAIRIEVDPTRVRAGEPRVILGSTARLHSLGIVLPPVDMLAVVDATLDEAASRIAA